MTQVHPSPVSHEPSPAGHGRTLADRWHHGEDYAVTFGGQGTDWFATLTELYDEEPDLSALTRLVDESARTVAPVADRLAAALPRPFAPQAWLADGASPTKADVLSAGLALPGVLLTQLATLDLLAGEGLDLSREAPVSAVGPS